MQLGHVRAESLQTMGLSGEYSVTASTMALRCVGIECFGVFLTVRMWHNETYRHSRDVQALQSTGLPAGRSSIGH
jgi:hypothetical protein